MADTLSQVGGLLLAALPTAVLLLLLFFSYRFILHGPLERTLRERRERTEGARQKAQADIAAADAKTAEYEDRIREAKVAIYRAQEARRRKALDIRAQVLAEARKAAEELVRSERQRLEAELSAAKSSLLPESEKLAQQVIATILRPAAAAETPAGRS
jgi:F-type H+-transporting ATPase subunit b